MPTAADAIRLHGPRISQTLSASQRRVLAAIARCRTGELGGVHYQCGSCKRDHWVGRSCGNRHCPTCGHEKSQRWVEKQRDKLMPVQHFMLTFTVPRELAVVLRDMKEDDQSEGYRCLFDASSSSIRDVAGATRSLKGCLLGFFGVLHTWGRDLQTYHPHVHFVVPGGGIKLDASGKPSGWQATAENFFVHHKTLTRVYKAKLADALRAAGLYHRVPAAAWRKKFVVDIQPVGHGLPAVKYLAPYVNRVAISNARMVAVSESEVAYRVKPSGTQQSVVRRVSGERFVRSFAQHILPSGFQKIRHYGWMSSNSRVRLDEVKWLVWLHLGWTFWLASAHAPQPDSLTQPMPCSHCGGEMRVVSVVLDPIWLPSLTTGTRSLAYFDSG